MRCSLTARSAGKCFLGWRFVSATLVVAGKPVGHPETCCAAALGTTIKTTRARTTATTTILTTATTISASGWCVRLTSTFSSSNAGTSFRLRLTGCGEEWLDGAGRSSPRECLRPRRAHTKERRRLGDKPRGASPLFLGGFLAGGLAHPAAEEAADFGDHAADVFVLAGGEPAPMMGEP